MPELAEVEFYRRRWQEAAAGATVREVAIHPGARPLRGVDGPGLRRALGGARLLSSQAAAKQLLFRFSRAGWLGLHLGMSGELRVEPAGFVPGRHDHLALRTARRTLVYSDPRMFGRVRWHAGAEPPAWWAAIAPPILSPAFTVASVAEFLRRHPRAPLKAVLLRQERFPGIGNWMADEILWRAALHPRLPAGSLRPTAITALWRECRRVCRLALKAVAGRGGRLPPDLNIAIPRSWLFPHRWEDGGRCPRTGAPLLRATIGGRTTCWSPARQKL